MQWNNIVSVKSKLLWERETDSEGELLYFSSELCQKIDDCVGFTFDEKDFGEHRCELKSSVERRKPSMRSAPFLISGPKHCVGKI